MSNEIDHSSLSSSPLDGGSARAPVTAARRTYGKRAREIDVAPVRCDDFFLATPSPSAGAGGLSAFLGIRVATGSGSEVSSLSRVGSLGAPSRLTLDHTGGSSGGSGHGGSHGGSVSTAIAARPLQQQLHIDLGQKKFDAETCAACGVVTCPGDSEDEIGRAHV